MLRQKGDLEEARKALVRAIQVDPNFTPALINLAVESLAQANLARAERLIRRALEIDPQETFAVLWLTWVLLLTQREEECLSVLKTIAVPSGETLWLRSSATPGTRSASRPVAKVKVKS